MWHLSILLVIDMAREIDLWVCSKLNRLFRELRLLICLFEYLSINMVIDLVREIDFRFFSNMKTNFWGNSGYRITSLNILHSYRYS